MIKTVQLNEVTSDFEEFILECDRRGFKNNNSLKELRWDWVVNEGHWFATYDGDKIVGLSGVHPFKDGVRALYRGAQLYSIPGGLTKNHMNCWMFYYHLPLVIDIYADVPIYITTNTDQDRSGKMLKLNKLYYILEKKGIVELVSTEKVFNCMQNIWKLNPETYFDLRPEEK
jgi:hypothetical protein